MGPPSSGNLGNPPRTETIRHAEALGGQACKLRFVLIGEGIALAGAIERLRQHGHLVVGIVACSEAEGQAMSRAGVPVCVKPVDPAGFIASLAFDVLLSINNGYRLRAKTLALPRLASINYHNSSLPAYAGLRATAWAVLHGELSHGVTWHHIDPEIDTGSIIVQRRFPLEPEETTASLNLRCTVAALESFEEVLDCLEDGRIEGRPQDLSGRSYFKRSDTVPGGGLIDWRWPQDRILRLVRACDWGNMANNFGSAAFAVAGEPARFVRSAAPAAGAASPGTVLGCERDTATVACGDGAVRLTTSSADGLSVGMVLPLLEEAQLEETGAIHRRALLTEYRWLPLLRHTQARSSTSSPNGVSQGSISSNASREEFSSAVSEVLGADTLVAVECEEAAHGLLQRWIPINAGEEMPNGMLAPLRDIARRHPELSKTAEWLSAVSVRIYRCGPMDPLPSGTIAFANGQVHFCGAHTLAHAVVSSMGSKVDASAEPSHASDPSDSGQTVLTMVAAQAYTDPHAPALEEDGRTTNRGDLRDRADRLARHLVAAGVQKEDGVGVLLPAGVNFVLGALAVMRAGAAYVPLSPAAPARRLAVEVGEAGIKHVVTDNQHKDDLKGLLIPFSLIDEIALPGDSTARLPRVFPGDCAYRIFTSGSTGKPKAVEITHGALANLINHYLSALPMQQSDRMTMLANPTFDASVADIWPILAAGGTLIVPPPRILLHLPELIDWLAGTASTCSFITTTVAERLLKMQWPRDMALRTLLTGGDVLHARPPAGLPFRLINTYGPTENTVDSLWSVVEPGPSRPTLGQPITGVTALVVAENGQPVLPGQVGELVLGGAQVARGYRGQPGLTAEKFMEADAGLRNYRTGDRSRVNEAGEFEFHGRIDYQLQILGQRVEPEEIEALLKSDRRVEEAVCLPSYQEQEVTGLVVWVVLVKEVNQDVAMEDALHVMLAEHLPLAIRPKKIRFCEDLPRTSAGKVDRRALTELATRPEQSRAPEEAHTVPEIWKRLLPRAQDTSGEESFWDLGGDSLAAINLLLEIEALTKIRVPIAYFLADPTLGGLVRLTADRASSTVIQLRRGTGLPLVCWHTLSGDLETYQQLTNQLGGRPIFGVISPSVTHDAGPAPSVEEMVADGLAALRRFGLIESPAMVGYSWGGLLAFEAARQLTLAGMPPPYVGLIGSAPPITRRSRTTRLLHFLRWGPERAWRVFRNGRASPDQKLSASYRRAARLLFAEGTLPETRSWKVPIEQAHVRLGLAYDPRPTVPVKLHLFRELGLRHYRDHLGYIRYDIPDYGWYQWAGMEPTVLWVDGHHENIMRGKSIHQVARLMETELDAVR